MQNRLGEGDCKLVILFLSCDEMTKVNHSNIQVPHSPFWNFSLTVDNHMISVLRAKRWKRMMSHI